MVEPKGQPAVLPRDQPGEQAERPETDDPDPGSRLHLAESHRVERDGERLDEGREFRVHRGRKPSQGGRGDGRVLREAAGVAATADHELQAEPAQAALVAEAQFASPAVGDRQHGGTVALLPVRNAGADLYDGTGELVSEDRAVGQEPIAPDAVVGAADPACGDLHDDAARGRLRVGYGLDREPAVAQGGCSHLRSAPVHNPDRVAPSKSSGHPSETSPPER